MGLFSSRFSTKQMAQLSYRLSSMTSGGIPIVRALSLLLEEPQGRPFRKILRPMVDVLQGGGSLAQALRAESKYLPDVFVETMIAGEMAGRLDMVLEDLTKHYEEVLRLQRLYWRGAMYPILLIITKEVIIPYVQGLVFAHDSMELYTLRFILGLIRAFGPTFLVILVLARLGILRKITDPIFSRIWPIAGFWRRFALARFCRCMGIMLGAGLGIRQSIERSAAVTTHPKLKRALCKAVPLVQQGVSLDDALQQTGVLPDMVRDMIRVGEVSGNDEELFYKAAEYLYAQAVYPVHTIGIGLTGYLILAWFVLLVFFALLSWIMGMLAESFSALW